MVEAAGGWDRLSAFVRWKRDTWRVSSAVVGEDVSVGHMRRVGAEKRFAKEAWWCRVQQEGRPWVQLERLWRARALATVPWGGGQSRVHLEPGQAESEWQMWSRLLLETCDVLRLLLPQRFLTLRCSSPWPLPFVIHSCAGVLQYAIARAMIIGGMISAGE